MRVLILGHYEIASNYAISLLINALKDDPNFDLRVALSGKGDNKLRQSNRADLNDFLKLAQYEQQLCDELNQGEDRLSLGACGFNQIAEIIAKPIALLSNPNSEKGLAQLKVWSPDLIISMRYRKIFRSAAIAIPKLGIINLHSGLLPEYRGVMATFWAMLNQEKSYGSTLHYITDQSIDTGAIIQRISQILDYEKSYLMNVLFLYLEGVEAVLKAIDEIKANRRIDVQLPKNKGNYYSFPEASDLKQFKAQANILY